MKEVAQPRARGRGRHRGDAGDRTIRGQPDSRKAVRKPHASRSPHYREMHVATPVEVCSAREVKDRHARQASGEITGSTGVDDLCEAPAHPEPRIAAHHQTVEESTAALHTLLTERGLA